MAGSQPDKANPGLLIRLRGMAPSLVPSLRRVADQILADPATVATRTVSELAAAASTSEATVLRLCRQLGVPGYRELRVILATESGREAERAGAQGFSQDIGRTDSLDAIIETVTFADQQAIVDTATTLDRGAVSRVVEALAGAGRIEVFGSGVSGIVAVDLQQKLHRRGLVAFSGADVHLALTGAGLLGRGDVLVAITASGETRDTLEVLAEANRRGALTACITSAWKSPAARAADEVLLTAARDTTFRTGAMSSRIAALSVVDILVIAVEQRHFDARVSALEATHSAVAVRRVEPEADTDERPARKGRGRR